MGFSRRVGSLAAKCVRVAGWSVMKLTSRVAVKRCRHFLTLSSCVLSDATTAAFDAFLRTMPCHSCHRQHPASTGARGQACRASTHLVYAVCFFRMFSILSNWGGSRVFHPSNTLSFLSHRAAWVPDHAGYPQQSLSMSSGSSDVGWVSRLLLSDAHRLQEALQ